MRGQGRPGLSGFRTAIVGALVGGALILACGAIYAQNAPQIVPRLTGDAAPMTNEPASPFARPVTDRFRRETIMP